MKNIKILIEIEKEFSADMRAEFKISDVLFFEFNRLFVHENLIFDTKKALKKLEGFSMLTINVLIDDKILTSKRYIDEYRSGVIKSSNFNGYVFNNFEIADKKQIFEDIKIMTHQANEKFISIVKK